VFGAAADAAIASARSSKASTSSAPPLSRADAQRELAHALRASCAARKTSS
jgi:hypothetical protein